MSAFEDSYKSQLQGVSQQVPRERLDGQVTAQDNMISDVVTNLRRRPGAAYAYSLSIANATPDNILAWDTDISGVQCQVILCTADGVVRILDTSYNLLATLPASTYLTTSNTNTIQVASVGDELFIVNTAKVPALGAGAAVGNPLLRGFYYVKAGAFSKQYAVTVKGGAATYTAVYTTPNGTSAGDAALSTPEYIANQLGVLINGQAGSTGVSVQVDGPFVYCASSAATCIVSTNSGPAYLVSSNASYLRVLADLPPRLPSLADGYIIRTGEFNTPQYYSYNHATLAWLEVGDFNSSMSITNVPVSVVKVGTAWTLQTSPFEGRYAGDDTTNPVPDFVARGITGMSTYQGRLVLLAGPMVCMSASNKPRRFYRSTVTSLLDSDCINVGASAASSAAWRYAVPYERDLILFSSKYQAVVPGGGTAITPRTASVTVTSKYSSDMTSIPVATGRSLMYAAPRSKDFFGLMEMLPSTTTDSLYVSYDVTPHLPKYMGGQCKFSVSSSAANMVLFSPTGDRKSLIVHEYTWEGDKKIQQSWHKWTFKYTVAAAYFSEQAVRILFVNNGVLVACTLDPRSGSLTASADYRAKLDLVSYVDVVNRQVNYPAWLQAFDPTQLGALRLSVATGPMAGEPVGFTAAGSTITTVPSFQSGRVSVGFPYLSTWSPTPPMMKDANGVKISSNKLTVLRFLIGTGNSAQYNVSVSDNATAEVEARETGTLYFSSPELDLGVALNGKDSVAIIPARTAADSTSLVVSTDGTGELNIISLEFVARYHEKIKRLRKG